MSAVLDVSGSVFDIIGLPDAGGVTWTWAQTDLDMASESAARAELADLLDREGPAGVLLVYLGEECFVDVRGLRLLLDVSTRLRKRGGQLLVVAPPVCLRRMIRLLDLAHEIQSTPTTQRAASWGTSSARRVAELRRPDGRALVPQGRVRS